MPRISFEVEFHSQFKGSPKSYYASLYSSSGDALVVASSYKDKADARRALKTEVLRILSDAKKSQDNKEYSMIGCTDGTVLLVRWSGLSWGYTIAGKNKDHIGGGMCGLDSFVEACQLAISQAEYRYGGICWKSVG